MIANGDKKKPTVQLHDWKNQKVLFAEPFADFFRSQVLMSRDGKRCFAVGRPGVIHSWNAETGASLTSPGHAAAISLIQWTTGGELASISANNDIRIWDLATGKQKHAFPEATPPDGSFVISKDGNTMYAAGPTEQLFAWDLKTRKPRERVGPEDSYPFIESLTISPNGKLLAGKNYKGMRVWNLNDGGKSNFLERVDTRPVKSMAFISDDRVLTWNFLDAQVRIWDVQTGKVSLTFTAKKDKKFGVHASQGVTLTPDRKYLVCSQLPSFGMDLNPVTQICFWDVANGDLFRHFPVGPVESTVHAISPDGKTLLVGDTKGVVQVWDIETATSITQFKDAHRGPITALAVSPDNRSFASGSADASIVVWDLPSRTKPK